MTVRILVSLARSTDQAQSLGTDRSVNLMLDLIRTETSVSLVGGPR